MSSPEHGCIVDTVVLLYFLLVGRDELLRDLLGDALRVPLTVYDPDDRSLGEEALRHVEFLSEMRQAVRHYEVNVRLGGSDHELLRRVRIVDDLFDSGALTVVEMVEVESSVAARLQGFDGVAEHGLSAPLGPGEAACVAIAWERGWTIATDDEAALTVLDNFHGGRSYAYERIRKLLIRVAEESRVSRDEANAIHAEMRALGFWDRDSPFP